MTDAEMMIRPLAWPRWPWLPVKRTTASGVGIECALIHADEAYADKPLKVYHTTLTKVGFFPTPEMEATEYTNLQELINDGWRVD